MIHQAPAEVFLSKRELNKKLGFEVEDENDEDEQAARLEKLWVWLTSGPHLGIPGPSTLVDEKQYFRGQSQSHFGLTTSLYRLCQGNVDGVRVQEQHLAAAEAAIMQALREEGMGRRMTDGELLMVCQHHGVPTRLLDVSSMPLEALYFAVEKEDQSDGRLFIITPHMSGQLPHCREPLELSATRDLYWARMARGPLQAAGEWTNEVRLVDEEPLDPRMRAQAGKFLVGGVHRAYGGLTMSGVDKEARTDITNFAINFAANTGPKKIHSSWPASGWTIRIPAKWKVEFRNRLTRLNETTEIEKIALDWMYPPVSEIRRLATHVAKSATASTVVPPES